MIRRIAFPVVAMLSALALGCEDPKSALTEVEAPAWSIQDGAHAGNAHFYFLPPLVPNPATTGVFDGSRATEVEICAWESNACAGAPLVTFTMDGDGSGSIRVEPEDEHYIVNWHTSDFDLDVDRTYRIRVLVDGLEAGHADVDPVSSGRELRNVDTDEFVALKDGRTLPIKFRIEQGLALDPPAPVWTGVAPGRSHTCALEADRRVLCWGYSYVGQLGQGSVSSELQSEPVEVVGDLAFTAITAGEVHTCGLDLAGAAYCWGSNTDYSRTLDFGQLGDGTLEDRYAPTAVVGGHTFDRIAAGVLHTCAIDGGGQGYCWGGNGLGQLGDGTEVRRTSPVPVQGGTGLVEIAAGRSHTCAIDGTGQAYCWGRNGSGELGDGSTSQSPVPVQVSGGHVFSRIAAGGLHTCGLDDGGQAFCWGDNGFGQLGDGTNTGHLAPVAVAGGLSFVEITAGHLHTCALTTDGRAYCWGRNGEGQLGDGTAVDRATPTEADAGPGLLAIAATMGRTCVIEVDGGVVCWGTLDGPPNNTGI